MTPEIHRPRALVVLAAAVAAAATLAGAAQGQGLSRDQLEAHGWSCVPFAPANRYSCFPPGLGRPFPGAPDPRPSYSFLAFDASSGALIGTGHLIRGDLYAGQPCAPGEEAYVFRGPIGYYECVRA